MIDSRDKKRRRFNVPDRTFILVLVPIFLIISSNVYPPIISSIENKGIKIITEALAQLEKTGTGSSNYHSILPTPSSQDLIASSPTPIDPIFSSASSDSKESRDIATATLTQQQDEGDDKMTATIINPGDQVHTVWEDDTPGTFDIFYKRDGADYDPTTVNFRDGIQTSENAAIAVIGNGVHIVWEEESSEVFYRRSVDSGASFGPVMLTLLLEFHNLQQ